MTAPSAKKISENSAELVPRVAPSDSSGTMLSFVVIVVTVAAAGVVPPITELSIVAPERVISLGIYASAIGVPCHSPEVMVPTSSMAESFPVVIIVPVAFGKVIVLSDRVGSSTESMVSKSFIDSPSRTIGETPAKIPIDDASTPVIFDPSPENAFAVIVDEVVRVLFPKSIALDDEVIDPSDRVRFPTVEPVAMVAVPVLRVPVVDKASFPKSIASEDEVIDPSAKVRLPTVEPVARVAVPALRVPVVDKASFPKSIASEDEVMDPFDKVKSPISEPDERVDTPAVSVPFVERLSLPNDMLSDSDAMVPSVNVKLPIVDPDPKVAIPVLSVPVVERSSSPKSI